MWIVYIVSLLIVIILTIGGYTFFTACRRKKELPWNNPDGLKNTPYEKHISLIKYSSKWLKQHNPQDIYIHSADGLSLHALWIPVDNPRGTILLAHGYRSTMLVDFGMVFDVYHKLGLNLLLPEQRCHGKSEGNYITFGVKESDDMLQWIRYHNENLSDGPIVVSGLSMGASTVMYMLDRELPANVKAAICDCGFTSPADIIGKIFRETVHIPSGLFIRSADIFSRIFAGFSLYEKDTRKVLRKNHIPILLVHGLADDFVPCEMTQEAYSVCSGEKYLVLAPDAGHGYSFMYAKEKYYSLICKLLDENL